MGKWKEDPKAKASGHGADSGKGMDSLSAHQKDALQRGSIKKKMLFRTITPTVAGLVIAGVLISVLAGRQIQILKNQSIKDSSLNAAYQISEYFTKYMEVGRQLGANQELAEMFTELEPGDKIAEAQQYDSVIATMTNMHHTDDENILVVWAADVDSSQCIEDGGYISEIGEWDITTRSWYSQVLAAKTTIVTEPYKNSSTGEMVASIVSPVFDAAGEMTGIAALDLSLSAVTDMMEEQKLGNTGFLILLTQDGTIMYADDAATLHTSIQDADIAEEVKKGFVDGKYGTYNYQYAGTKCYGYMTQAGESQWVVLSGMPGLEYNMDFYKLVGSSVCLFAIVIVVLCVIITRIASGIVHPIHELHGVADKIANGELDVEMRVSSNDEIGAVAESIEKTVERLKHYINYIDEIAEVLGEIADGNLRYTLKQDYAGEFGKIKTGLENLSKILADTIEGIDATATQVTSGSGQIAQAAQSLAEGAVNQAAAVEELLATVTDISGQVKNNAEYAKHAAEDADTVRDNIERSNQEMRQLVSAMEEINECSNAINAIIANIEEIADQTNLLSLNASIEAARAGEMGKGFAVVANEVGNLSKESVLAVQKSTELIVNSINAVKQGMDLVNNAAERLSESVDGVINLTNSINELSAIAGNQMDSLMEVEKGLNQISGVVNDNSAMSEESAASSEELSAQAAALNEMIEFFKI